MSNKFLLRLQLPLLALQLLQCIIGYAQMVPWLTRAGDNSRSGWNSHETVLTQQSVLAKGVSLQPLIPVVGDARGMEAQPLIVPEVQTARGKRDVMLLPSMANVVRGVDAHDGSAIWQTALGMPITGSTRFDFHGINDHWGCLSTGVVVGQRLYQVCWVSMDGSGTPESGRYLMHVVDVATGKLVVPPIPVQGTDTQRMWKQRSSLVYVANKGNAGTIFFAHGSVREIEDGFPGGITAFDVESNAVAAQLPMTSGIWMAGCGLIADAAGDLYAITGNGAFDPSKGWFGEAFIKVRYIPSHVEYHHLDQSLSDESAPWLMRGGMFTVIDQWSPWTDFERSGQATVPAGKIAGESMASEVQKHVGRRASLPSSGLLRPRKRISTPRLGRSIKQFLNELTGIAIRICQFHTPQARSNAPESQQGNCPYKQTELYA